MSIGELWDFARLSVVNEGRVWLIPRFICWIYARVPQVRRS